MRIYLKILWASIFLFAAPVSHAETISLNSTHKILNITQSSYVYEMSEEEANENIEKGKIEFINKFKKYEGEELKFNYSNNTHWLNSKSKIIPRII